MFAVFKLGNKPKEIWYPFFTDLRKAYPAMGFVLLILLTNFAETSSAKIFVVINSAILDFLFEART